MKILGLQRKAEKEMKRYEALYIEYKRGHFTKSRVDGKEFLTWLLSQVFKELEQDFFKRDKEGEIEYNKKGFPKVDWRKVVLSLPQIIGKIIVVWMGYQQFKGKNGIH